MKRPPLGLKFSPRYARDGYIQITSRNLDEDYPLEHARAHLSHFGELELRLEFVLLRRPTRVGEERLVDSVLERLQLERNGRRAIIVKIKRESVKKHLAYISGTGNFFAMVHIFFE